MTQQCDCNPCHCQPNCNCTGAPIKSACQCGPECKCGPDCACAK